MTLNILIDFYFDSMSAVGKADISDKDPIVPIKLYFLPFNPEIKCKKLDSILLIVPKSIEG